MGLVLRANIKFKMLLKRVKERKLRKKQGIEVIEDGEEKEKKLEVIKEDQESVKDEVDKEESAKSFGTDSSSIVFLYF